MRSPCPSFESLVLAIALALAGAVPAQSVDVPFGYGNVECNNASAYPFGRGNGACRVQYIYDTTNFTMAGVDHLIQIDSVQLRCNGGATNAGGMHTSVNYRLGLANADHLVLSTSFDGTYLGGAPAFVPSGPLAVANAAGTSPNNYYVVLPVAPFLYDPSLGDDLIIEIAFPTGTFTGNASNTTAASVDLHFNAPDSRGARVFSSSDTAATGSFQSSSAHAMKFVYTVPAGVATRTPFGDGCGTPALALDCNPRPILGTTVALTTGNVPGAAVFSANMLSFTQFVPAIDLTPIGMPGCLQHVGISATALVFGSPTAARNLALPSTPGLAGTVIYSQSVSVVPGVNPLGALSSNGVQLVVGTR